MIYHDAPNLLLEGNQQKVIRKSQRHRADDESSQHDGDHAPAGDGHCACYRTDGCSCAGDEKRQHGALTHPRVHEGFDERHGGFGVEIEWDAEYCREGDAERVA